jgi:predicted ester cyclase
VRRCILVLLVVAAAALQVPGALTMAREGMPAQQSPAVASQPSSPVQSSPSTPATAPAQSAAPSAGGQPAPGQSANAPAEHAPDWAPLQYVDIWNKGDFDIMRVHNEVFAPGTFLTSHGQFQPLRLDRLQQVVKAWHEAAPDLHFDVKDTIVSADGKKVVLRLLGHGTFVKPLFGPLWQGQPRRVFFTETLIFELQNGKIHQIWEDYDEARMHLLMGQHYCPNEVSKPTADSPDATSSAPSFI